MSVDLPTEPPEDTDVVFVSIIMTTRGGLMRTVSGITRRFEMEVDLGMPGSGRVSIGCDLREMRVQEVER